MVGDLEPGNDIRQRPYRNPPLNSFIMVCLPRGGTVAASVIYPYVVAAVPSGVVLVVYLRDLLICELAAEVTQHAHAQVR